MSPEREEFYVKLIKESESLIEVCRKANIVPTTGNYDTLKKLIKEKNLDTSHFKRSSRVGICGVRRDTQVYLNNEYFITAYKLKNRLLKEGYKEHKCEVCGNTEWNGKPIPLELHHLNGDKMDNRIENLQIICPNCHAFTENYSGKNAKRPKSKNKHTKRASNKGVSMLKDEEVKKIVLIAMSAKTLNEVVKKTGHTQRTVKKALKQNNIVEPNKNKKLKTDNDKKLPAILDSLKRTRSFTGTGKEFGVSDNAIKKLLVSRGYPPHIKDLLLLIDKM